MSVETLQSEYCEENLQNEDQTPTEDRESCRNFVKTCRKKLFESEFLEDGNTLMEFISSSKSIKIS